MPDNRREKLDAKIVEGYFVSLPENKKGNVSFFIVLDRPEWVKVQGREESNITNKELIDAGKTRAISPESVCEAEIESKDSIAYKQMSLVSIEEIKGKKSPIEI